MSSNTLQGVLSTARRPARTGTFAAVLTIAWRTLLKIKHVPFQLFDVLVFPIMMTFMFTYLFGGALAGSTKTYVQWLIPGIVVQTMVFLTVYTGVSLNADIQKGLFDRFKSLPIWQPAPVVGALLGDLSRYALAAIIVILVGLLLGFRPAGGTLGVVAAIALILLFVSSVSWMWIVVGMLVKSPESVMTTSTMFLFPLTFVSNIFVDPKTMPGFMQAIISFNPVTHLTNASRGLMLGNVLFSDVLWVLIASAIVTAVFAPIAMRLYYQER